MKRKRMVASLVLAASFVMSAMPFGKAPLLRADGIETDDVEINSSNFPDAVFRSYISSSIDKNSDGVLSDTERSIKSIDVHSKAINDLKGIEYFTSITNLDCSYNQLTSLDVSKNTALTKLSCYSNQLTSLDVSKNTALKEIDCSGNQLTSLDLSKNTELTRLKCNSNDLTSLDVSKNTKLVNLNCHSNKLTSLDVSKNTELKVLNCGFNKLTSLNVSYNTALNELFCSNNNLTSLNLSYNTALNELGCSDNKFASLDLRSCALLTDLSCYGNSMLAIDVSGCQAIASLVNTHSDSSWKRTSSCKYLESSSVSIYVGLNVTVVGQTVSINATNFPDANFRTYVSSTYDKDGDGLLDWIGVSSMDVSGKNIANLQGIGYFYDLTDLNCSSNQLTSLDLSENTALTVLSCYSNKLTSLDLSKNTALTVLSCYSNKLTSLDLTKNTALKTVYCQNNELSTLNIAKLSELSFLRCESNNLSSLSLLDCPLLNDLVKNNAFVFTSSCKTCESNVSGVVHFVMVDRLLPVIVDSTEIEINSKNFPDENFRNSVYAYDKDNSGTLNSTERDAVTNISVSSKSITSLKGVEFFTKLTQLDCSSNQLTSLDLSKNTALTQLNCSANQLTSLDLSKNTALKSVYCQDNKLTTLKLGTQKDLYFLRCDSNKLEGLSISGCPLLVDLVKNHPFVNSTTTKKSENSVSGQLYCVMVDIDDFVQSASSEIVINTTNFPDVNFRKHFIVPADTDLSGTLSSSEISSITEINCSGYDISDLKGIEYFTALTLLNCEDNYLTTLDVSKNTKLVYLNCSNNELTSLDVSKNTALTELYCSSNQLTSLFVINNTKLEILYCDGNAITGLNLNSNTKLNILYCGSNELSELKVSNLPLVELSCYDNKLTSLDVSKNRKLKELSCFNNQLTELDLRQNTQLMRLVCYGNSISSISVEYCSWLILVLQQYPIKNSTDCKVSEGDVYGETPCAVIVDLTTEITGDDEIIINVNFPDANFRSYVASSKVDKNLSGTLSADEIAAVTEINVNNKDISDLTGIEYFTALEKLECYNNQLTSLDVSKNTMLYYLDCSYNYLTSLDVSSNTYLMTLYCNCNEIPSLDLSNNTALESLSCYTNALTSLDVSKNTALSYLDCEGNQLTSLDVSNNIALECLYCCENQIATLSLGKNTVLGYLNCVHNKLTSLDVSGCTALIELYCSDNQLASLDVTKNMALQYLDCSINQLSVLDLSNSISLLSLDCSMNKLSSLDLSVTQSLQSLYCGSNLISELDLSSNLALCALGCEKNLITELYLGCCPQMVYLWQYYPPVYDPETNTMVTIIEGGYLSYDYGVKVTLEKPTTPVPGPDTPTPAPDTPTPAPDTPTPEPHPVTDPTFEDFVERLYTVALNRESEPEGKAYWVDQVVNKGASGADCARFFLLSAPEFMNRNLPDDVFIETLYQTFFGRASEGEGKSYWLMRLATGSTKEELVNEFIESVEWCNICSRYGVKSGAVYHKATFASKNAIKFATRLYTCCLGRDPEDEGLQYWSLALTNLEATGYQAASLFFTLPEFVGLNTTNEEYLTRLYKTFMGRDPEADGFAYWLGLLNGGMDRVEVMKTFASCPEFQEICNQYGIDRGPI